MTCLLSKIDILFDITPCKMYNRAMNSEFLQQLRQITPQEQRLLNGDKIDNREYFSAGSYVIQSASVLKDKPIAATMHPRFCKFPLHGHDYMEVMYVCSGQITHVIDGKRLTVRQGGLLMLNKYTTHEIETASTDDIGVNFILSDVFLAEVQRNQVGDDALTRFVTDNLQRNGCGKYLLFDVSDSFPIRNLLDNLIYTVADPLQTDLSLTPKLVSLLFDYLALHPMTLVEGASPADNESLFRKTVDGYIATEYPTASLARLAKKMHLSEEHLCRKISHTYKKNFKKLLLERRLLAAEKLLSQTDKNVEEIATAVGYDNISYFYRCFYAKHRQTPKQYRDTQRK